MLFGVPQYIDVEDKIAGPLTAKQLLWMFGMGATLLILWSMLEQAAFFVVAVPVVIFFLAFAFYRPYNQPLIKFVFSGFTFLLRPKIYSWQRTPEIKKGKKHSSAQLLTGRKEKKVSLDEIKELAKVVDSGGRESSEKAMEIIKAHTVPKNKSEKKEHQVHFLEKSFVKPAEPKERGEKSFATDSEEEKKGAVDPTRVLPPAPDEQNKKVLEEIKKKENQIKFFN